MNGFACRLGSVLAELAARTASTLNLPSSRLLIEPLAASLCSPSFPRPSCRPHSLRLMPSAVEIAIDSLQLKTLEAENPDCAAVR